MTTNDYTTELPGDLRSIASAVNELAEHDRAGARGSLEDRLFMATRRSLAEASGTSPVVVRRVGFLTRMRIAAAIALVGSVAAVWLGRMHSPLAGGGATVASADRALRMEQDVDLLLALRNTGTGLETMTDTIDLIALDADVIGDSLQPDWPSSIDDGATR